MVRLYLQNINTTNKIEKNDIINNVYKNTIYKNIYLYTNILTKLFGLLFLGIFLFFFFNWITFFHQF